MKTRTPDSPSGGTPSANTRPLATAWSPRAYWLTIAAIAAVGVALRFLILAEYLADNPLARSPRVDALTYWNWAGRIALGHWRESTPFFSAPLYPYLLGIVRALGGGLPTVYSIQIIIDGVTTLLLALIALRRFGPLPGILAAALFVLLRDPASFTLRILTSTIQLPLICLAWLALENLQRSPSFLRAALAGGAIGLLSLSYPPAMLLLLALVPWSWWLGNWRWRGLARGALVYPVGAIVIAPATIHNYVATNGDFFAIQAVSAINLRQGNGPGANGTIGTIPGFSRDRENLFRAAQVAYEREFGRAGTWGEIQRYHRDKVLEFWQAAPLRTAGLVLTKLWWCLTAHNYADIYNPNLEIDTGLTTRLQLAIIETPWVFPLALVGAAALVLRVRKFFPEIALLTLPIFVTCVFWYSPRYRSPALPAITVLSAWTLAQAWRHRRSIWPWAAGVALAAVIGTQLANRAVGFDSLDGPRPHFEYTIGVAHTDLGESAAAAEHLRTACKLDDDFLPAKVALATALRQTGDDAAAVAMLEEVLRFDPAQPHAHNSLGVLYAQRGDPQRALTHFQAAMKINPAMSEIRTNLANALVALGRTTAALPEYKRALAAKPNDSITLYNYGRALSATGSYVDAAAAFEHALRVDPTASHVWPELGHALLATGAYERAAAALERAIEPDPDNITALNDLAWLLATCPDANLRDGPRAVELAQAACDATSNADANLLDTLAAAFAEAGDYAQAVGTIERAIQLALAAEMRALADTLEARRELYRQERPYHEH